MASWALWQSHFQRWVDTQVLLPSTEARASCFQRLPHPPHPSPGDFVLAASSSARPSHPFIQEKDSCCWIGRNITSPRKPSCDPSPASPDQVVL